MLTLGPQFYIEIEIELSIDNTLVIYSEFHGYRLPDEM